MTDTAGAVTDTYFYTAFGEEFAKTGTNENEFRYVGEQWDPNAGFYYLRARWYDQSTGRFASVDPYWELNNQCVECELQQAILNGCIECQNEYLKEHVNENGFRNRKEMAKPVVDYNQNRYKYSNCNPVNYNDPKGEYAIVLFSGSAISLSLRSTIETVRAPLYMGALAFAVALANKTKLIETISVEPKSLKYLEPEEPIPGLDCFPRYNKRIRDCEKISSPTARAICKGTAKALLVGCLTIQFGINPFL